MANKGNKYKVGFLAILFIVLLIIALMSLGVWKYFLPKIQFMTATTGSVQGLSKGAKVKIKGVPVGHVTRIQIGMQGSYIYIFMEFDPTTFIKSSDIKIKVSEMKKYFEENLQNQIAAGMRCQLQYEGITGQMYVEIKNVDLKKRKFDNPEKIFIPKNHPLYIPSIPQASIANMLEDAQLAIKNIGDISSNLKNMTNTFSEVINKDKVDEMTNNVKKAVIDFGLLANETRKNLRESNIPETLSTTREMIRNLNILIKYIDMNPDALIRGRTERNIVPPFTSSPVNKGFQHE
ncbi:MAG TPA: MlaD family protein [Victivallales bacterium]|nr:MlaD family protein [Victivallales bacterium]